MPLWTVGWTTLRITTAATTVEGVEAVLVVWCQVCLICVTYLDGVRGL